MKVISNLFFSAIFSMGLMTAQVVHAADAVDKAQDAVGDAKTNLKKENRAAGQSYRKATGTDNIGKDAKDKANDVGDDVSNTVAKGKRRVKN